MVSMLTSDEQTQLENATADAIYRLVDDLISQGTFHPGHKLYVRRLLQNCDLTDMTVVLDHLQDDESIEELKTNLYRSYAVNYWEKSISYATEDELSSDSGDAMLVVATQMESENWSEEDKKKRWDQIEADMFRIENNTARWHDELNGMYSNGELDDHSYNALKSFPSNPTQDPVEIKTIQHFMDMGPRAYHKLNVEHEKQAVKKRRRNLAILIAAIIGVVIIANA
ncbi:hypothetical protein N9M22_04790 [Litoricolaceae bacterium]|nr:hypothetical protein [Litorivicinaceae bacterium]